MKICSFCDRNENETEFTAKSFRSCKECTKKYNENYRRNNLDITREKERAYSFTLRGRCRVLYKRAKIRSKNKKLDFDLSLDFIEAMWHKQNGKCALTGINFILDENEQNYTSHPFTPSIDRINSNKGYTKDNVRLVCVAVNYALNEFGESIFRQICEAYLSSSTK